MHDEAAKYVFIWVMWGWKKYVVLDFNVQTSLHAPPRCLGTFSSALHNMITIALPFLLTQESTSPQRECLPWCGTTGARGGWLSRGGIKSGLKPSPGPLALKLRLHAHVSAWASECSCGRGVHWKVKNQPTSSLRRRRGEQRRAGRWVCVGDCINPVSSTTVLKLIYLQ